jgi:glycosyltransferase involved in cell wall biosynthesis
MKVLFVSSGNSGKIDPIASSQTQMLVSAGIHVDNFLIVGKGFKGYLRNIPKLKSHIKNNNYDVVHAHYSLTAFVAALAGAKPLVVSLMGSDVHTNKLNNLIIKLFNLLFWNEVIVKSNEMRIKIGLKNVHVIANGVNLDQFEFIDKQQARHQLGWNSDKIHLFFPANTRRYEKNYPLIASSLKMFNDHSIEIHNLDNAIDTELMNLHYQASDIVLLSSLWEGSPNVIKEALACNKIVVSTDVGDVNERFGKLKGVFIAKHDTHDYFSQIKEAIEFLKANNSVEGRKSIIAQGLDGKSFAQRLIEIYITLQSKAQFS